MKAFNIQFVNILTRTLITEQDKYLTFFKGQIRSRIVESSDQDPITNVTVRVFLLIFLH